MGVLTVVVAAAPSILLLAYFYLRDRFEREPLGHLAVAYFVGMYAMLAAHGLGTVAEGWFSIGWLDSRQESARFVDAFVLSSLLEELTKAVTFVLVIYRWREFDEPLDGVIYGVTLSLGFATLENWLYLSRLGLDVAWQRAVFAVPAHALFGGAMGYYIGKAKFANRRSPPRWIDWALCLVLPVVFHGAYDFALLHGLNWRVWIAVAFISIGLWVFVLRRVHSAQRASPYRPKTMPPPPRGFPR